MSGHIRVWILDEENRHDLEKIAGEPIGDLAVMKAYWALHAADGRFWVLPHVAFRDLYNIIGTGPDGSMWAEPIQV